MICNTKQEALDRVAYLAHKATSVPVSDLMKWIIKEEVKEHITAWELTRTELLEAAE
jgi:hypothetical protein